MEAFLKHTKSFVVILVMSSSILLMCCSRRMSEEISDDSAGINGSFEKTKSGLPVNWLLYSPQTIPSGDYDLILDSTNFKDGRQSLKFLVRECSAAGGWRSPGLAKEYHAKPAETYKVSFWIQNTGCVVRVQFGGVSAFEGKMETILNLQEDIDAWKQFEYTYQMPPDKDFNRIRFELNILRPGNFWIDDVRIEGPEGKTVTPTIR